MNNTENIDISNLIEFSKIIKDLLNDLINTFPDKTETLILNNPGMVKIINSNFNKINDSSDNNQDDNQDDNLENDEEFVKHATVLFKFCKDIFPLKFFDILYQNEEIFSDNNELFFLPNINFTELYFDTTSIKTKETLWKYLQLILFSIITNIQDKESFGNNEKLFEAINSDEFKNKLEDTVKSMGNLFSQKEDSDTSANNPFENVFSAMNIDPSNINNLPNTDTIHDHINKLINGKLGNLAKELAEETTKDLDIDVENVTDINDLFKNLFKNPNKLMNIVNKISGKLDEKMKDGSLKESEILEEASEIFKNMQDMPGMGNFKDIFKSMNMDQFMPKGGKFNNNAFQNMMDQNIKTSRTKERMRKKAEFNKSKTTDDVRSAATNNLPEEPNLNEINDNLAALMEGMKSNPAMFGGIGAGPVKTPPIPGPSGPAKTNKKKKGKGKKN
tara:strand:- start:7584 stop:8921 length:1338 start_codon:yes stop_codon:yes gene_type:complete